jgi:hypothetical protein
MRKPALVLKVEQFHIVGMVKLLCTGDNWVLKMKEDFPVEYVYLSSQVGSMVWHLM